MSSFLTLSLQSKIGLKRVFTKDLKGYMKNTAPSPVLHSTTDKLCCSFPMWRSALMCFLRLFPQSSMQLPSIELRRSLSWGRCKRAAASGIGSAPVPRLAQRLTASDENLRQPRRQTWIAQRGLPAAGSRGEAAQRGACARKQACPRIYEKKRWH